MNAFRVNDTKVHKRYEFMMSFNMFRALSREIYLVNIFSDISLCIHILLMDPAHERTCNYIFISDFRCRIASISSGALERSLQS